MLTRFIRGGSFAWAAIAVSLLAGCGSPVVAPTSQATSTLQAAGIPPQSAFVVVSARVVQLLPDDNVGLPHQNFVVKLNATGETYTVNNDTKYGTKVPNLEVGTVMTIRGTTYNNSGRKGLHWTHHADRPGDAGYIQTSEGRFE